MPWASRKSALGLGSKGDFRLRGGSRFDENKRQADFAIPDGDNSLIAIAVKVFSSTGSKLTDAIREINAMVEVKQTRQYLFAVVDGQGWMRRRIDLRGIHALWADKLIDGMYPRGQLDVLAKDLKDAAIRVGLRDP